MVGEQVWVVPAPSGWRRRHLDQMVAPALALGVARGIAGAPGRRGRGRVVVVDCPESLQVSRAAARSGLDPAEVRAIMAAQWPRWRRLQAADDVIWNGGSLAALDTQVAALDRRIRGA